MKCISHSLHITVLYYYYSTHLRSPTITLRPRPRPFPGAESCLFFCRRSKTRTSPASGCRFFGASTPRRLWCFGFACLLLWFWLFWANRRRGRRHAFRGITLRCVTWFYDGHSLRLIPRAWGSACAAKHLNMPTAPWAVKGRFRKRFSAVSSTSLVEKGGRLRNVIYLLFFYNPAGASLIACH